MYLEAWVCLSNRTIRQNHGVRFIKKIVGFFLVFWFVNDCYSSLVFLNHWFTVLFYQIPIIQYWPEKDSARYGSFMLKKEDTEKQPSFVKNKFTLTEVEVLA